MKKLVIVAPLVLLIGIGIEVYGYKTQKNNNQVTPPIVTNVSSCKASDLHANVSGGGGGGNVIGFIWLTNKTAKTCSLPLHMYPSLQVLEQGKPLLVNERQGRTNCGVRNGYPCPSGQTLQLQPNQKAVTSYRWGNWCGSKLVEPPVFLITLPQNNGQISVSLQGVEAPYPPRCDSPTTPSNMEVGTFELSLLQ